MCCCLLIKDALKIEIIINVKKAESKNVIINYCPCETKEVSIVVKQM